jgi:DNA-binding NarL/FixJ family response regulator
MNIGLVEILLIEDNKIFRKTLGDIINKSGKMICQHAYGSCEDALQAIEEEDLAPAVILLDIGLPGMNGVQGIPHLKKMIPGAKIIILTIHDDDDNVFNAICAGADGYLLKDSSSEKIVEQISEVQSGGAPMNAHIASKILDMFKKMAPSQGEYHLTNREREILKYLVDGLAKKEISDKLFISYHTVDNHVRNIYEKLEVHSSSSAVAKALKENLL